MLFDVQNIEYRVHNDHILSHLSLCVEQGQSVVLLGPSGCGKTSLMNIMAGLLKPSAGDVVFNKQAYSSMAARQLDQLRAENFGFVFQRLHLIGHLTVMQNVALAQTKNDTGRVQALIAELGLSGQSNQKARDLSVGEAQRVAIARAVVHHPKVIFADEPTSALDDVNANKVMDLIFDQAEKSGAAIIAATHDSRIKNRFEKIVEMS